MKKILFSTIILILGLNSVAQERSYDKGDLMLNLGISVFHPNNFKINVASSTYSSKSSLVLPGLSAKLEYGFHKWISAGPSVGYRITNNSSKISYNVNSAYTSSELEVREGKMALGLSGSFHFVNMIQDLWVPDLTLNQKFDFYVAVTPGVFLTKENEVHTFQNIDGSTTVTKEVRSKVGGFIAGLVGARFYLGSNFALFAEAGEGYLGRLTAGVTLKF